MNDALADLSQVLADVADAVGLQEGSAGVQRVLRALDELDSTSTRAVSRHVNLPLPLVAAVNNELRSRGVVSTDRPSRLTARGQALLAAAPGSIDVDPACATCAGRGVVLPPVLAGLHDRLEAMLRLAPAAELALDQSHSTVETKLRRIALLLDWGVLPASGLLLVGDDDFMSLTVALAAQAIGQPLVGRLVVVDVSTAVLDFLGAAAAELGVTVERVRHDLRDPLPTELWAGFDLVITDPPYTTEGARLFLSRAAEGLRPGPGSTVAFSFGAKGPQDSLEVQAEITALGLAIESSHPDFNEYDGAGVIGGRSNLQRLITTSGTKPVVSGRFAGDLYTADKRAANRTYLCLGCGARLMVGPTAADWTTIADLKAAGCPVCSEHRFRPLQLVREGLAGRDDDA